MNNTASILVSATLLASLHVLPANAAWPFVAGDAQPLPSGSIHDGNPGMRLMRDCSAATGVLTHLASHSMFPGQMLQAMFPVARPEPAHVDAGADLGRSCPTDSGGGDGCLFQRLPFGQ